MARDQVLGLEVVMADGRVLDTMRSLQKDNTGYDLKQLFIGAEGTLGVITAAVLKLHALPAQRQTLCLGVESPAAALEVLAALRSAPAVTVHALELMPRVGVELVVEHIPDCAHPLDAESDWLVLADLEMADEAALPSVVESLLTLENVVDGIMATSEQQAAQLWRVRESFSAAQKAAGVSLKHDVSVPLACIPQLLVEGGARIEALCPGARVVAFGHIGDGNIHFNVSEPADGPGRLLAAAPAITEGLYDLVSQLGGSFSAEHGIGQLKVELLERYRSPVELDLMRTLKSAFDPNGILNPAKILRPE